MTTSQKVSYEEGHSAFGGRSAKNSSRIPSLEPAPLDWSRLDIEQRIGFPGGRFTRTNNVFTGLLALILTVGFYACLIPFDGQWAADMFTKRGPTPYAIVLLSWWAVAILLVKSSKLRLQRRALSFHVMPEEIGRAHV